MPTNLFDLLLLVLASFRVTHLLVFDTIAAPLRRVLGGEGEPDKRPWLGTLITCFWCCGVWVSAGWLLLYATFPVAMRWPLVIFAVAGGQSALEGFLHKED